MTCRPIIDAGPGLNFLSINQERLLIATLGRLSVPETVERELLRKSAADRRFTAAAAVWTKLTPRWIEVLPDDVTPELAAVVARITQLPMPRRMREPKDLGETMVIAHAVVAAEAGHDLTVFIDDGAGARTASRESARLTALRAGGRGVGSLTLVNTETVLLRAAARGWVADWAAMRTLYEKMRGLDDGLPPVETTKLLDAAMWRSRRRP